MGLYFPKDLLDFRSSPTFMNRLTAKQVQRLKDELSALIKEQSDSESSHPSRISNQERAKCVQHVLRIGQIRNILRDNPPSAALPRNQPSNSEIVARNDLQPKAPIAA